MLNLLTIDVEDWFHCSALDPYIDQTQWDTLTSRLEYNVMSLLEILNNHQVKATFFILGWVAERYPGLIREIDACGHEIGSHGYRHRLIYKLSRSTFKEYLCRSKQVLEDLVSKPVLGYRATSFSVINRTLWALEEIKAVGFVYDSSIFPIKHDIYGISRAPRFSYVHENGLIEVPPSTVRVLGKNLPIAGGGYFRLYPYLITKKGIESINREGHPAMVYLHPWELDPNCPEVNNIDRLSRFRMYINLAQTRNRLERLISHFKFIPVKAYLEAANLITPQDS